MTAQKKLNNFKKGDAKIAVITSCVAKQNSACFSFGFRLKNKNKQNKWNLRFWFLN